MAKFIYKAKLDAENIKEGEIEAENHASAVNELVNQGLYPIWVKPLHQDTPSALSGRRRLKKSELVLFTRELADLLSSGLTLLEAINVLTQQSGHSYQSILLESIAEELKQGSTFSQALSKHADSFNPLYINLVKSGEASGALEAALGRVADHIEREEELNAEITSRLTYPIIVLGLGLVTVVVLLVFLVPQLLEIFEESGQVLPLATRILIGISDFLINWWYLIITGIVVGILIIKRILSSPDMRFLIDKLRIKLPLVGSLILRLEIANFARTLGALLAGGLSALPAVEITGLCLRNQLCIDSCEKIKTKLADGASVSSAMKEIELFPPFVVNMIAVGEEGGELESTLKRIELSYQRQVDRQVRFLTTLLEPVLILSIGLVVFFIVLAILLPIFEMNIGGL